jgi:Putative Zn-dependent protease, contains TPR repeats
MRHIILLTFLLPFCSFAQNTIGGVKASVPEEEVKRQSQFLAAERERLLNHQDKALELYKKFTYDHPGVDAGWYGLARTYVAKKDLTNALQAIGKAVTLAPDNRWYAILQADIYEKLGRVPEAIGVYEALVKRFPNVPEFYEQLSYLCLQNEDPKKALKVLDKWESLVGVNETVAFKKHVVYLGMGDTKKAAAEYQKLCAAYPRELKYWHRLAEFYETVGDKANSRAAYAEILRRSPNDPVAKVAMAGAQSQTDEGKLAALRPLFEDVKVPIDEKIKVLMPYFQKAVGGNVALFPPLQELGAVLEKTHPDDAKTWSLSGDLYYHADKPVEALERYRKCIALNPTVFAVWENAMTLLAAQKGYDELFSTAAKAMDAFPNQPKSYYFYGAAANLKGRPDEAIPMLEQGLLMTASNTALRLDMLDQIGLALLAKKDFSGAVAHYEKTMPSGGDRHPGILEHLGDAYSLNGQKSKAQEYWKKAQALRPSAVLEQKIE